MAKQPKGSRHKPRRTIALTPAMYEALAKLAARNDRPVQWEGVRAIRRVLQEADLWPKDDPDEARGA